MFKGDFVYKQGDKVKNFYIVRSGEFEMYLDTVFH